MVATPSGVAFVNIPDALHDDLSVPIFITISPVWQDKVLQDRAFDYPPPVTRYPLQAQNQRFLFWNGSSLHGVESDTDNLPSRKLSTVNLDIGHCGRSGFAAFLGHTCGIHPVQKWSSTRFPCFPVHTVPSEISLCRLDRRDCLATEGSLGGLCPYRYSIESMSYDEERGTFVAISTTHSGFHRILFVMDVLPSLSLLLQVHIQSHFPLVMLCAFR